MELIRLIAAVIAAAALAQITPAQAGEPAPSSSGSIASSTPVLRTDSAPVEDPGKRTPKSRSALGQAMAALVESMDAPKQAVNERPSPNAPATDATPPALPQQTPTQDSAVAVQADPD